MNDGAGRWTRPRRRAGFVLACLCALLAACDRLSPRPGIGAAVSFAQLPGWTDGKQAQAWPALLASCARLAHRPEHPGWDAPCDAARALPIPDDAQARAFVEQFFQPFELVGSWWRRQALFTGYYEPLLEGARVPGERYRYPVYTAPTDLVRVELGELHSELKGKTVRGRLEGRRVTPYPSRAQIEDTGLLAGQELLWVDDPVALFFLHIQGSGRVRLPDGTVIGVGYADQNGHPYTAIGRLLAAAGEIPLEQVSMFSIRDWLRAHPDRADGVMRGNASYIFFRERPLTGAGPEGSLGVALTPGRSLAIDPAVVPRGVPVWIDTVLPDATTSVMRRLMLAQDTGGAIKGPLRADVFFGAGPEAERLAGHMKQPGRMYVLLPRTLTPPAR